MTLNEDGSWYYDSRFFYELDYENRACVDCKGALPQFASINNGVLICGTCSLKHSAFSYNISFIRELKQEWDNYLLSYIVRGGNSRFIRFCNDYDLNDMPIEDKYQTKILEYYRWTLKSEILAEVPPMLIYKSDAKLECDKETDYFSEFSNYTIYRGDKTSRDFFDKNVNSTSKKWIQSAKAIGSTVESLAQNEDVKNTLYSAGTTVINTVIGVGGFIVKTSKPAVKFITKQVVKGVGAMCNHIEKQWYDESSPDNDNDKDNDNSNTNNGNNNNTINNYNNNNNDNVNINNNIQEQKIWNGTNMNDYNFSPCTDFPTYSLILKQNNTPNENNIQFQDTNYNNEYTPNNININDQQEQYLNNQNMYWNNQNENVLNFPNQNEYKNPMYNKPNLDNQN